MILIFVSCLRVGQCCGLKNTTLIFRKKKLSSILFVILDEDMEKKIRMDQITFSLSCQITSDFESLMFQTILMPPFLELKMDTRWTPSVSTINGLMFLYNGPKIWEIRKIKQTFLYYCSLNGLFLTIWDKACSLKVELDAKLSSTINQQIFHENRINQRI